MRNFFKAEGKLLVSAAALVVNLITSTKKRSFFDLMRWSALLRLRRMLVLVGDPAVEYNFRGTKLRMPLSHDLPLIVRDHPLYAENLGRIAAQLSTKYQNLTIIDIGANIGDSAAIIRRHISAPVLCIEGEPRFGSLLVDNAATRLPGAEIELCYVGTNAHSLTAVVHDGTARLTQAAVGSSTAKVKTLEEVLEAHPGFERSKLVKVDTDGMDIAILRSALTWITARRPVLFFEYDPDLQVPHRVSGLELLSTLNGIGYHHVLVYEANGEYMFSADLENKRLFSELHEYLSGRGSRKYCDFCIFHREDADIAETTRCKELAVFRSARGYMPAPDAKNIAR